MLLKYRLSNLQSEPKNVYKMKKVVLKNLAEGIVYKKKKNNNHPSLGYFRRLSKLCTVYILIHLT